MCCFWVINYRLSINKFTLHKTYSMRKRSVSILALAIAGLITTFLFMMFRTVTAITSVNPDNEGSIIELPQTDTAFGGIFYTPRFNDSLPHYQYRRMEDSVNKIKAERELENRSVSVSGMSMGLFGVFSMNAPGRTAEKYYYVGLNGYKLDHNSKFFIQNGTYNLAYVKWNTTAKKTNWQHGHYERKSIRVRYAAENERVLVPVNQNQYKALQALLYVLYFGLLVGGLYFFIGIPVQILTNISRGNAFDENNVRYFNIMARVFFVMGLLSLLSPYILRFFLRNIVPMDFERASFAEGLWEVCWMFLLSIAVFITGKAFQKGNSLQKEQDLTI